MTWDIPSKIMNYHHSRDVIQINQLHISTKKSHWMDPARSNAGLKLTLVALAEYTRAQYKDFYRARSNVEKREFQEVKSRLDYLQVRYASPNVLVTLSEWNGMISVADPATHVCVNPMRHSQVVEFQSKGDAQAHRLACIPDNGH
jgi:hypothetical protein